MKYLIEKPDYGRLVEVYRNLHKECYSVRDVKTRRVIYHTKEIVLGDTEFKVSETGRQRVVATGRKNVHAVVRGTWLNTSLNSLILSKLYYNPYVTKTFIDSGMNPVSQKPLVLLTTTGVYEGEVYERA